MRTPARLNAALGVLLLAAVVASPAVAEEERFSNRLAGHLSVGYAKLFAEASDRYASASATVR